jgi:hypothetical protein
VDSGYRDLPFPFPELPVPSFAMQHAFTLDELVGYIGTWSAVQRYRDACGVDPLPIVGRAVAATWGPRTHARVLHFPLSVRVGRKPEHA